MDVSQIVPKIIIKELKQANKLTIVSLVISIIALGIAIYALFK